MIPSMFQPEIFFIEDYEADMSRIIICDDWSGDVSDAKILMHRMFDRLGSGRKVDFLITCGGFLTFDWRLTQFAGE